MPPSRLAESWDDISPLLDRALEMPDRAREAWLETIRTQTPELAERLAALLAAHRSLSDERFLEHAAPLPGAEPLRPASIFGAYALIVPIGEGGMGTVWLAERTDGELQRKVALKFISVGSRRADLRERFLRERQLLASLNHPAIVQLIDAGHTNDGEPYLVMEYVDGQPIDQYAAALSIADRLSLFLKVCDGVAHAHRRLIIHRDLKPSNILVDRTGQPKLLDFGIAKLLDDTGHDTATLLRVLTPKYASPEQFRGTAHTTATDIYSLGAVLYRLLTGVSPHDAGSPPPSHPDGHEGGRPIPAASTLNPAAPVDLDYILRKALRPEPEDRYASVDAVASDIRAVLESRPVEARSGDRWYRSRKFLLRHRLQVGAAVLIVVSLSVGLYIANRERVIAQRRFQQVRQLANQFIALDADLRLLPGTTTIRRHVVSESLGYLEQLGREAGRDADLSFEIGNAYRQVGEVLGVPNVANLGQYSDAEQTLGKGDAFIDRVLASLPSDRRAWLTSAQIQRDWMALLDYQDRRPEALSYAEKAAARVDRFLALGKPSPEEVDEVTLLYMNIATAYSNSYRFDEEIAFCQRALAISEGVPAAERRRAAAYGTLSVALLNRGDLENALTAARTSRTLLEPLAANGGRNELFNLSAAYLREGQVLGQVEGPSLKRSTEAAVAFNRALEIGESLADRDGSDSASRVRIGVVAIELIDLLRDDNPAKALAISDHALARSREVTQNTRTRVAQVEVLARSSYAARRLNREDDARLRVNQALNILQDLKEYPTDSIDPNGDVYTAVTALAAHYAATDQMSAAIETYRRLLAGVIASKPRPSQVLKDAILMSDVWTGLAGALRKANQVDEAASLDAQRAAIWAAWDQKLPNNPFIRSEIGLLGPR
jgi:serine/threonine protein kinase/tetratricopeptide (TPR) repeat protein